MLSNYIISAFTDTFTETVQNWQTKLGQPNNTSPSFQSYFQLAKYEPNTKYTIFRYPLADTVQNRYFELSFISSIKINASNEVTKEPIPYINETDLQSSNFYAQYVTLKPVTITFSGQYNSCKIYDKYITTPIRNITQATSAMADSLHLPSIRGVQNKINKVLDKVDNVIGQVSQAVTSITNTAETIAQEIQQTIKLNINEAPTQDVLMKKYLLSVLALRLTRHPIDLNIGCMVFSNMLLTDYNFDIPYDQRSNIGDFVLTFEHIPSYKPNTPPVLQNALKKKKYSTVSLS